MNLIYYAIKLILRFRLLFSFLSVRQENLFILLLLTGSFISRKIMPSSSKKMSMASSSKKKKAEQHTDAVEALHKIKSLWPKFEVTQKDLANPTRAFVMKFFTEFLDEIARRGLTVEYEMTPEQQEFSNDTNLVFLRLSQVLNQFGGFSFCFGDLVEPTSTRFIGGAKLCVHFLEYISTVSGTFEELPKKVLNMQKEVKRLQQVKEQLLEKSGENATQIAMREDKYNLMVQKYGNLQVMEEHIQHDKKKMDEIYEKRKAEQDALESKCGSLNDHLLELEYKNRVLKAEIVDDDITKMKEVEAKLKLELAQTLDLESKLRSNKLPDIRELEDVKKELAKLPSEALESVTKALSDSKRKIQQFHEEVTTLEKEVLCGKEARQQGQAQVQELSLTLKTLKEELQRTKDEAMKEVSNCEGQLLGQQRILDATKQKAKLKQREIENMEREIEAVDEKTDLVKKHFAKEYQRILNTHSRCTEALNTFLQGIISTDK